jgi:hypothetical protein
LTSDDPPDLVDQAIVEGLQRIDDIAGRLGRKRGDDDRCESLIVAVAPLIAAASRPFKSKDITSQRDRLSLSMVGVLPSQEWTHASLPPTAGRSINAIQIKSFAARLLHSEERLALKASLRGRASCGLDKMKLYFLMLLIGMIVALSNLPRRAKQVGKSIVRWRRPPIPFEGSVSPRLSE